MTEQPKESVGRMFRRKEPAWRKQLENGLRLTELFCLVIGAAVALTRVGSDTVLPPAGSPLYFTAPVSAAVLLMSRAFRVGYGLVKQGSRRNAGFVLLTFPVLWVLVFIGICIIRPDGFSTARLLMVSAEVLLALEFALRLLRSLQRIAARTHNSAMLLVGSFILLVGLGTLILMLPVCRAGGSQGADWDVALFTATSASCVTGLIVEPTGSYWSSAGHVVILALLQIGGLGILTFGAFVAVLSGRYGLQFRDAQTLRDMLDSDDIRHTRRLLLTILLFTVVTELVGAVSLLGLWGDKPFGERCWFALFHSVSAFCNAGFSLQDDGLLGMGARWQVWGPVSLLIILGGLGFPVVQDMWSCLLQRRLRTQDPFYGRVGIRRRLSTHSRIVLLTAGCLLIGGTVIYGILESLQHSGESTAGERLADAWFQSVTFRTAGFNTVDHAQMHPATKLMAIFLMFIGAAPGSTGGGVKTVVFAVAFLNVVSVLRGRDRVEVFGRRIPSFQIGRALAIIAVGVVVVMCTAGLLVIFEKQPDRFVDHLFEATSAFATVGVSAGVTGDLSLPSRLVIIVVMFLGRVGPITLLLAMASGGEQHLYEYPSERVSLG